VSRLDPWTELQFAARAASERRASIAGAAICAERPTFINTKNLPLAARGHALMLNALKSICLGWRDVPEDPQPQIAASVAALCAALEMWPAADRAPLRTPQKRERYERAVPRDLHWMRD